MSSIGRRHGSIHVIKEGPMEKKSRILSLWKPRYFVLMSDILCYHKREEQKGNSKPTGRIFVSDILSVNEYSWKNKPFCILLRTESKTHLIACSSEKERQDWFKAILNGIDDHKNKEESEPVRRKSCRLDRNFKRITITKDANHGIGCSIKNVGGAIYVSRITPDGPIAVSGVLRPGDQFIEINGHKVSGYSIQQIKAIIVASPEYVVCTVKPVTHYSNKEGNMNVKRSAYTEVDPTYLEALSGDKDGSDNKNAPSNYANVDVDSPDGKLTMQDHKRFARSGNLNYIDNNDLVLPKSGHIDEEETGRKYAELDFSAR